MSDEELSTSDKEHRDGVDRFLKNRVGGLGGAPCLVCHHPRRYELEQAAIRFNEQRKLWGTVKEVEGGETVLLGTNVSWNKFAMAHLKPKYGYNGRDERAIRRHLENHRDTPTF